MAKQSLPDLLRRSLVLSVPGVAVFAGVGVAIDKAMMAPPAFYIQNWVAALYEELSREKGEPKFTTMASPGAFKDSVKFDSAREIQSSLFQEFHDHLKEPHTVKAKGGPTPEEIKAIIDVLSNESLAPEYAIDKAIDLMTDIYFKVRPPVRSVKFRPVFLTPPQESAYVTELRKRTAAALDELDLRRSELRTKCPSQFSSSEDVKDALRLLTALCSQSRNIYIKLRTIDDGSGGDRDLHYRFLKAESHVKRATERLAESSSLHSEEFGRARALLHDYSRNMQARMTEIGRRLNL
jgi:hypothetical protein